MNAVGIDWLGDRALLLRFADALDPATLDRATNERVHAAARKLRGARIAGVEEIVAAYASLCVHYDPAALRAPNEAARAELVARVCELICEGDGNEDEVGEGRGQDDEAPEIEIPVCYGGDFGPDLAEVAALAGFDEANTIAAHTAASYRVAMLGFAPGFPYLLGLDPRLHAPRRAQPRTRVPAGSVAIGGAQTGIYPRALPGGWQIIGRTPLALFDAARTAPALLAPGQRVRFRAIDAQAFAALAR
jgi:KipI family sensor histidine kinase inhibitor